MIASPNIRCVAWQRSRVLCKLISPYRLQGSDELQSRWMLDERSFTMQEEVVLRLETLQLCKVRVSIRTLMLEMICLLETAQHEFMPFGVLSAAVYSAGEQNCYCLSKALCECRTGQKLCRAQPACWMRAWSKRASRQAYVCTYRYKHLLGTHWLTRASNNCCR